jgi:hypothetical protein
MKGNGVTKKSNEIGFFTPAELARASGQHADDDELRLEPGDEILFSTPKYVISIEQEFDRDGASDEAPGTSRCGIVSKVAPDSAVLVQITSER